MAKSAVSSLRDLYNSIAAGAFGGTTRPPIFLGSVPTKDASGADQRVPYTEMTDEGFRPEYSSDGSAVETGTILLRVYAVDLDAASGVTVDSIVRAIKFGGSAPPVKAGFDWGSFTFAAGSFLYKISLRRLSERRDYAGFNYNQSRVHMCELRYECKVGLNLS